MENRIRPKIKKESEIPVNIYKGEHQMVSPFTGSKGE